jgi:hypothetical protein
MAAAIYLDLIAVKGSGKSKYSSEAATSITKIKYKLMNSAIADLKGIKLL